jgi:sec-independent protein translocase protein TatA
MFDGAGVPWHWAVVALVALALFGYKRMPDAARSLGRSLRIFKTEIKGLGEDDKAREAAKPAVEAAPVAPASTEVPSAEVATQPVATPVATPAVSETVAAPE